MDANPNTGVALYDSWDYGSGTPWFPGYMGGTSLACPLWAGVVAVADEGRAVAGAGSLDGPGGTLPRLYKLPAADFHDITTGSNGDAAGPGYDLASGLGTPVGNSLIPDLATPLWTVGTRLKATEGTPLSNVGVATFVDQWAPGDRQLCRHDQLGRRPGLGGHDLAFQRHVHRQRQPHLRHARQLFGRRDDQPRLGRTARRSAPLPWPTRFCCPAARLPAPSRTERPS